MSSISQSFKALVGLVVKLEGLGNKNQVRPVAGPMHPRQRNFRPEGVKRSWNGERKQQSNQARAHATPQGQLYPTQLLSKELIVDNALTVDLGHIWPRTTKPPRPTTMLKRPATIVASSVI